MVLDKKFAGAAVQTTVVGSMTPTVPGAGQTFTLTDPTGWPTGGNFVVVNSVELSNEEKILCSRSGATCTVVQRGYDGTTPQTHSAGSPCEHRLDAATMTTLANHVDGLEANPHSGVLLDNAAHDVEARHTFGAALGTPVTPTALTPDIAGAAGTGNNPAREDHAHNVPADVATTITGANAEGIGASFARNDHNHAIGGTNHIPGAALVDNSVTALQIAPDAIGSSELAADSVGSSELAPAAIDDENLFSAGLSPIIVAAANPGAVGAHRFWFNTTSAKLALLKRNAADTGWEVIQGLVGVNYTPTLYNFGVDGTTGVNVARYNRKGDLIIVNGYIELGGAGAFISGRMGVGLPVLAKDLSGTFTAGFYGHGAARALDASAIQVWAGVGLIGHNATFAQRDRMDFIGTGGGVDWDATHPFVWNGVSGDRFSWFAEYEPASLEDTNWV